MRSIGKKVQRYLPLTETTFCILAALAQPRHGYGVMQRVESASRGRVLLGPGTLYGALTTLLRQGLIERAGSGDGGDQRRKLYRLTGLGRAVVDAESHRLVQAVLLGRELLGIQGGLDGE